MTGRDLPDIGGLLVALYRTAIAFYAFLFVTGIIGLIFLVSWCLKHVHIR